MIKTITESFLDGYESGEVDFLTRFGLSSEAMQIDIETNILNPLLAVLNTVDESAVLTITGHSDRVDTEGTTREQRRQQELTASLDRANSAAAGIQQIIRDNLPGVVPAEFEALAQLAILPRPGGAAVLREFTDVLSEDQRKLNRRIQMRVVRFQPG